MKRTYKAGEPDEIQQARGSNGGKVPRKPYRFSTRDVAEAARTTLWSTRKAIREGRLDPHDLTSLSRWVVANLEAAEAYDRRQAEMLKNLNKWLDSHTAPDQVPGTSVYSQQVTQWDDRSTAPACLGGVRTAGR